ncbi:MAG TPA: hypothetical protein VJ867_10285 [Gemmatimonadaceae bacterium]|nr:hypothetical protein [Gemmatimonadaceae bacterium]
MKRLGDVLMGVGVAIGAVVAIKLAMGVRVNGMPFLVSVGLVKLTLLTALSFLAAGAAARRIGKRRDAQATERMGT